MAREISPRDSRELRNFARFLWMWPHRSFDMIQRPRWQRYLGLTTEEVEALNRAISARTALAVKEAFRK